MKVLLIALFCMNATQAEIDQRIKNLKALDAALEVNDFPKATTLLHAIDASIPHDSAPIVSLVLRTQRDRALLLSRNPTSTDEDRARAKEIFEKEVLGAKPDPSMQADYGEILSRIPVESAAATTKLRALRDKDLMGSAHGYAALAGLEKAAGDAAAETSARAKCRVRTKVPTICD